MKTYLLSLITIAILTSSAFAASPEETLAQLQIQEVALQAKLRPESPRLRELQAQIESLQSVKGIQNNKYFECLNTNLLALQNERETASKKYKVTNPKITVLDKQINFIQAQLSKKSG